MTGLESLTNLKRQQQEDTAIQQEQLDQAGTKP